MFTLGRGSNIPASPQSATNPKLAHPLHQRNYGKPLHQRLSGFYGMGENSIHVSRVIMENHSISVYLDFMEWEKTQSMFFGLLRVILLKTTPSAFFGFFWKTAPSAFLWNVMENHSISVSLECFGKPLHQRFSRLFWKTTPSAFFQIVLENYSNNVFLGSGWQTTPSLFLWVIMENHPIQVFLGSY